MLLNALDHLGIGQMSLQQLGAGGRLVVELGDVAVSLRVVVHRVDHDLAAQLLDRHLRVAPQRDGDDDDVARSGGLRRGCRAGVRAELGDDVGQRLGSPAVAEYDVVAGRHGQSRDGAADVSASDESPGCHGAVNSPDEATIPVDSPAGAVNGQAHSVRVPLRVPTQEVRMSRVVHFEIQVDDVERAKAFYAAAFGWSFQDYSAVHRLAVLGDRHGPGGPAGHQRRPVAAARPRPGRSQGTNAFVCTMGVGDYDETERRILEAGGQVALPKMALTGMAWQGYYLDTEGNTFGIHQPDPAAA